jgi:hypothetical protein
MERVTSGLGRQGVVQQDASWHFSRLDEFRGHLEIAARFLLGPIRVTRRQFRQLEGVIGFLVTSVAAGVTGPFFSERSARRAF